MTHSASFPIHHDMSNLALQTRIELNDGSKVPILGLGVYEMLGAETYNGVMDALKAGYRLIDSAEWYGNEKECGEAIRDFCARTGIPRSDVVFTTKLETNRGFEAAKKSIRLSLELCGLGYIDIYLLHSPLGGPRLRKESWRAATDAQAKGLVKTIGVSNYGLEHLRELAADEHAVVPALNQIDLHPFMTRNAIVEYCQQKDIVLQAWAPLVRGLRFNHPVIKRLATKYKKEPAQILIRYSLQKGFICIPKSSQKDRIISNANCFDFNMTDTEIAELSGLDEYFVTDWDPTTAP